MGNKYVWGSDGKQGGGMTTDRDQECTEPYYANLQGYEPENGMWIAPNIQSFLKIHMQHSIG